MEIKQDKRWQDGAYRENIRIGSDLNSIALWISQYHWSAISRKPNDHAKAYFSAIIPETKKDSYVEKASVADRIEIIQVEQGQKRGVLFKGLVTRIKVKTVRSIYYLEVEALSSTYELDIKLKTRSFQNERLSYEELFHKVLQDYNGADCNDQVSNGAKLERFIIQYEETDWQFLKRVASRLGAVLISPKWAGQSPSGDWWDSKSRWSLLVSGNYIIYCRR